MKVVCATHNICPSLITVEIENNIIKSIFFDRGCSGNQQGIIKLAVGQKADEIIKKLKGIKCHMKSTSCPDQLAEALEYALNSQKEQQELNNS